MTTDILSELNPKQREAVETIEGPLLIVAGPGSGKTRVITHRIAYLVQVCGVAPHRISALTFTNKAAKEMRHRLTTLMGHHIQGLTAGTFHSFCAMILRRDGEPLGLDHNFSIYDDSDQLELIKRSMKEVEIDPKRFSPRAIQSAISSAKSQLLDIDEFASSGETYFDEIVLRIYQKYSHLLNQSAAVDFDDLLLKTYLLLEKFPEVAQKYQNRYVHFMIDEFQDTNVAQYAIAKRLSATYRNLCVVGDPDQSIYSWRNADIRNILSFQRDYPEAKLIALEENYRSTQTILDASQKLIASNTQRVEKGLWTKNKPGGPILAIEGYDEKEEAQLVVEEIQSLSLKDGYALGDIAVMYRVNAQSRAIEEACMRYGTSYQVIGGVKFYLRQEIKDLIAYLRLIVNPNDDVSLVRVINQPSRGIGLRTLDTLANFARDLSISMFAAIEMLDHNGRNDKKGIQQDHTLPTNPLRPRATQSLINFQGLITGLASESESLDLIELVDLILERTGYKRHLLDEMDQGEERWENIQEFRVTARDFLHLGVRNSLTAFLESISLVSEVDALKDTTDTTTLITLHQAKGLEFPVVFMVGMEEGLLPHLRSMDNPEAMEEERRLCYVGMTRAKERLYLLRAFRRSFRGMSEPGIPSRFLMDIPTDLLVPSCRKASNTLGSIDRTKKRTFHSGTQTSSIGIQKASHDELIELPAGSGDSSGLPVMFTAGDKVSHSTFGEGIIINCIPSGNDFEATVAFKEGKGVKRLLLSIAALKQLN